jgi:hypothetical protein
MKSQLFALLFDAALPRVLVAVLVVAGTGRAALAQNSAAPVAGMATEAFTNLANGMAASEKVFSDGIRGFRFVPQAGSDKTTLEGVLLAPKATQRLSRVVRGAKGLYIYYSTNQGAKTKMTVRSKGGTNDVGEFVPGPAAAGASGGGGSTEERGDTLTMTVTNLTAAPVFLAFAAVTEGDAAAGARFKTIAGIRGAGRQVGPGT